MANFKKFLNLNVGQIYTAKDIVGLCAPGDIKSITEWMNTSVNKLIFTYKLVSVAVFEKQAKEMFATYEEFPKDKERTNKILNLIKKEKLYPVFVEEGDNSNFIMEGRHRIVAFFLSGIKEIPVFYVSINDS